MSSLFDLNDRIFAAMDELDAANDENIEQAIEKAKVKTQLFATAINNANTMSRIASMQEQTMDGLALNIRIHPTAVARDDGIIKLRDMTKAYFDQGGVEVQYNVVDAKTLRAAQANPDDYHNLVVRIAGFSAYFVDMSETMQEDIISRAEHTV